MKKSFQLNLVAASLAALFLSGCGDAETNIVEKDPIEVPDDSDDMIMTMMVMTMITVTNIQLNH